MPVKNCQGCGRITNSAVSNYWDEEHFGTPTKCKAAFVDGKWVPGCDYGSEPEDEAEYASMFEHPQPPKDK